MAQGDESRPRPASAPSLRDATPGDDGALPLIEDLRADLQRLAAMGARQELMVGELRAALDTLLQILRVRETLSEGHLAMIDKLRQHVRTAAEPQLVLGSTPDKYAVEVSEIDCAARMALCHGRCCSYNIPLSEQDLVEGKVAWRIREPYYLAQRANGSCAYQSEDTGACGNYAFRPAPCRTYDCRHDRRVWIDFDARIPAPMPEGLVTLRRPGARDPG
jgi:Fe-S-cluster containining protein